MGARELIEQRVDEADGEITKIVLEYSDPGAAHDAGNRHKSKGAFRVIITPKGGKHVLEAWYKTTEAAAAALKSR